MRRAGAVGLVIIVLTTACTAHRQDDPPLPTRPAPSAAAALDGRSTPVADPVYPAYGNPAIDVLRYQLDLAWDPATRVLAGTATLTVRPTTGAAGFTLDFSGAYTVDGVTVDGATATTTRTGNDLTISHGVTEDRPVTAVVRYHGRPATVPFPGNRTDVSTLGLHVTGDGALWAMQEPYGAFTWFPCNDQPSDEALYDISITVPDGWTGVSNGTPTTTGRKHTWHAAEPIATYLVTLVVDRFDRVDDRGPHGLPITYWVRPQEKDRMLPTLRQTPRLLDWLERRLGPYPFSSAGVVVAQSRSAMETQTMITMGPLTGENAVPVLLHEFAHHWFGDAVTPRTWRDMWLNEGFAMYLQGVYTAETTNGDLDGILRGWRAQDAQLRADNGPPGRYRPDRFGARNVYLSAGLMLHEIRTTLGDRAFFAMLHDWVQHHVHTTQDRASFTSWLRAYTGRDLSPLIDRWLDSPTTP